MSQGLEQKAYARKAARQAARKKLAKLKEKKATRGKKMEARAARKKEVGPVQPQKRKLQTKTKQQKAAPVAAKTGPNGPIGQILRQTRAKGVGQAAARKSAAARQSAGGPK